MSGPSWFAGLTADHLFANCPSRLRGEATLRMFGWWDISGEGLDPDGTDVCGTCLHRLRRRRTVFAAPSPGGSL